MRTTPDENSLKGKRAVVTGAGSGIGRATAITLAAAGAEVALLGRTADELEEVFEEAGGSGSGHRIVVADVSDEHGMISAYQEIGKSWKSLDIVVANAGINGVWAPLENLEVSEWDETLAVNLRGTFLTVKLAVPFLKRKGGSVIVVSSINGNRIFSNSGATAYS
ncbi:MAG: SDR family NAD(P)-dependent oxidoreductase, partial [Verrucomicrobiaceae bacterium]